MAKTSCEGSTAYTSTRAPAADRSSAFQAAAALRPTTTARLSSSARKIGSRASASMRGAGVSRGLRLIIGGSRKLPPVGWSRRGSSWVDPCCPPRWRAANHNRGGASAWYEAAINFHASRGRGATQLNLRCNWLQCSRFLAARPAGKLPGPAAPRLRFGLWVSVGRVAGSRRNRSPRRASSSRGDPRGARLQRTDAIGKAALALLAAGRCALLLACAVALKPHGFVGQNRLNGGAGAFEHGRQAHDLGGNVVDTLAQERVLDPLRRPGGLRL